MKEDEPTFNIHAAHNYFSTELFSIAWEYIEQADERTAEEDLTMLHMAIASLWHWTQRADVQAENLSVGHWQVSRVYNLLKQPHNARTYGLLALKYAEGLDPFFKAYAYETLARAEMQAGNRVIMNAYIEKSKELVSQLKQEEDRVLLLKYLSSIK
jgi:hypothetical protein